MGGCSSVHDRTCRFVVHVRIGLVLSFGISAGAGLFMMASALGLVLAYLLFDSLTRGVRAGGLVLVLASAMQLASAYSSFGLVGMAFVLAACLFLYSAVLVIGQV